MSALVYFPERKTDSYQFGSPFLQHFEQWLILFDRNLFTLDSQNPREYFISWSIERGIIFDLPLRDKKIPGSGLTYPLGGFLKQGERS
jgi:hypothetical protein